MKPFSKHCTLDPFEPSTKLILTLDSKLVETVVSKFSARSENGRYKALVLLSNGNGLTQTETRNLANMLYRNNLVDLVLPVMIDSACTERSDSDNCPNLINLARWASPDSGKAFFVQKIF